MLNNELLFNNIKKLCDNKGIKITNLEKELGFGGGIISRWGNGADPSLSKVVDIADYFHVTLDEVVGRNQNTNDNDEKQAVIASLMQMTINKELQWQNVEDYKSRAINNKSYEQLFSLYVGEETEIYKSKYNESNIFLIAQYDLEQGTVENLDIELYLQPDNDSVPVVQDINSEFIQEFWIGIRKPFKGIPDEWKAETIKKQIIADGEQSILNSYSKYLENVPKTNASVDELLADKKAKQILTEADTPEIQQLISLFTNPKMTQAMESAQKLITYFNDIKDIKEDK